ncbi:MAG: hypothetical protein F4139_05275 [Gemmatimonadetes bacterium]|nr:hypothetical protein [Gemmatimonadota bacterium]MYK65020.1 hypothetical protein [Gemmatimonadota bacterium]
MRKRMSDPYREATRHSRSRGMPTFARVALIVGGLFIVLVSVLVMIGLAVAKRIADGIGDFSEQPAATLASMMDNLGTDVTVVSSNEDEGTVVLRVGSSDELVTVDISEPSEPDRQAGEPDREAADPDQEAASGSVRFDGEADRSGGILRVDTESGRTTVELRGTEDGGFLDISTPGHEVRFGAGTSSSALPDWVPVYPGARLSKRQFSVELDKGSAGGAVFRSDAAPDRIFDWYNEALEGHLTSYSFSRVRMGKVERASMEASAWEDETQGLSLNISWDEDDGNTVIAIVYRSGEL